MIKSMTGYARDENTINEFTTIAEIRSYNSKYLDIVLRLPHGYHRLDEKIKSLVSAIITRGRIEIKLYIQDASENFYAFEVNTSKAEAYHNSLIQLKDNLNIEKGIPLQLIAGMEDIIKPVEMERDLESDWIAINDCISKAVDGLDEMRTKEGNFLAKDLSERIDAIEKSIHQIEKESADLLPEYQKRLKERISALTKGIVEIDPGRVAQESAFLADRSDISEEIVRTKSHLKQFRSIMNASEPAGRKLNFLLQELNREFNTMGSKAGSADASHIIVEIKSELERIREQVQNVE